MVPLVDAEHLQKFYKAALVTFCLSVVLSTD